MPALILPLILAACSDYEVSNPDGGSIYNPDIEVSPPELVFEPMPVGDSASAQLTLRNRGDASLTLYSVTPAGAAGFSLASAAPERLSPDESATLTVLYTAGAPEDLGWIVITSDDEGDPELQVPLYGAALFGELAIAPNPYDFGTLPVACPREVNIELFNVGEAPVTVDELRQTGEGYSLELPALPITLAPGEFSVARLRFEGGAEGSFPGETLVVSSETVDQTAAQTASVVPRVNALDTFVQPSPSNGQVDIIIHVDRSGSMDNDARILSDNFRVLTDTLEDLSDDYHIIVVTRDDGCCNGEIITPYTADPERAFENAVFQNGGGYTEAGLTVTSNALENTAPGRCNEDFRRGTAALGVVMISDEPEQSRHDWSHYVEIFQEAVPEVTLSAVAGPIEGGCSTATPGRGYWEAANATGGVFLNICTQWGDSLVEVGEAVVFPDPTDTFGLSGEPVVDTIEVTVDAIDRFDWIYDAELNAVVFAVMPPGEAEIEIRYEVEPVCD